MTVSNQEIGVSVLSVSAIFRLICGAVLIVFLVFLVFHFYCLERCVLISHLIYVRNTIYWYWSSTHVASHLSCVMILRLHLWQVEKLILIHILPGGRKLIKNNNLRSVK